MRVGTALYVPPQLLTPSVPSIETVLAVIAARPQTHVAAQAAAADVVDPAQLAAGRVDVYA